ncbi:MAG: branched-chain amino acid ABC transporter permease [Deltaproteobacteria bacterium]
MDILINGTLLGSAFAMMGLGFALLFGVGKVFDLAYGSYFALVPYFTVALSPFFYFKFGLGLAFLLGLLLTIVFAFCLHRFLINPIRMKPMNVFILTLAVAVIVQELFIAVWGSSDINIPSVWPGTTSILGVRVLNQKLLILIMSVIMIIVLWAFLTKTKAGLAIRVVAEKPPVAQFVGIKVNRIFLLTAVIGAIVSGISGYLMCSIYSASPLSWMEALNTGFVVIIMAGLGNIWGVIPAGLLMGIIETLISFSFPQGAYMKRPVVLVILILLLVFRPHGLFGVKGWVEEEYKA